MPMKYFPSAMPKSKRKPHLKHLPTQLVETSSRCSSVLWDCDADDEGFMSSGEFVPSRPLSLVIPNAGPYFPRRPTLQEVLQNTAPPPWTLSAFMAYLSQNHCLETLEFTMDAQRYTTHYTSMKSKDPLTPISATSPDCEYVRMLWQKLVDAYITPNGPREINLPSAVRDRLLSLPCNFIPPDATELQPAVKIIYELMDESVLVPFLNSVAPPRLSDSYSSPWTSDENIADTQMAASLDERSLSPSRTRNQRDGSPPNDAHSYSGLSPRPSHQSHLTAAFGRSAPSRLSTFVSTGSSIESSSDPLESMTDDTTDSPSPSGSAMEPMTPPNTPPTSNADFAGVSSSSSPHTVRGEASSWKKMGAKLGFKKHRSTPNSSHTSNSRYSSRREGSQESGGSS